MRLTKTIATTVVLLSVSIPAIAAFDYGGASDFNVYVFGDYYGRNGDTQGRLAVGGSLDIGNYAVIETKDHEYINYLSDEAVGLSLVVAGQSTFNDVTVRYGDSVLNQRVKASGTTFNRDLNLNSTSNFNHTVVHGTLTAASDPNATRSVWNNYATGSLDLPTDFTGTKEYFERYADRLATYDQNGKVTRTDYTKEGDPYLLKLTGDGNSEIQVFNLTSEDLANAYDISLVNIGDSTSILINVDGTDVVFSNMGPHDAKGNIVNADSILQDLYQDNDVDILFNLYNAETVTFEDIALYGAVLAPDADAVGTEGRVTGRLIANSFYSDANFQFNVDDNTTPAVPEPSTYLMMGLGLGLIGYLVRRKNHRTI